MMMRHWLAWSAAALALAVAGCSGTDEGNQVAGPPGGQKIAPIAPPDAGDWAQMVTQTEEGGYRLGNPDAPVKLLEYGSFGCGHCAVFEAEAAEPLKEYIRSGRVSWEFRPFMIFPSDPAVSVLAACHGPDAYFLLKEQLYASQAEWLKRLAEWMEQNQQQIQQMSPPARLKPMIQAAGLDTFFRQRGMPQTRIDACLADTRALGRALEVSRRGSEDFGVDSTPSFFINRVKINAGSWPDVEKQLKRALGE